MPRLHSGFEHFMTRSLCDLWLFGVPGVPLPEVRDCAAENGTTALFGGSDPPP
jgi:hypothetical protein